MRRFNPDLLLVVLIWGLNFPVIKVPLEVLHPLAVNLLRFGASAAVLAALWARDARARGEAFAGPMRDRPFAIVGLGLVGHLAYQALFILGVARTAAGSAALLMASNPVWTALLGHALGVDRLRWRQAAGLAVSALGVAVVVLGGGRAVDFSGGALVGNALVLLAALAWALYTVLSRPVLARGMAPLGLTFWGVVAALPGLALLGWPTLPTDASAWARVDGLSWAALLYSGAISTGLASALWTTAVAREGPQRAAAFSNLTPFVALLAGAALLDEAITPQQILGGGLIIAGLVVVRRFGPGSEAARQPSAEEPAATPPVSGGR